VDVDVGHVHLRNHLKQFPLFLQNWWGCWCRTRAPAQTFECDFHYFCKTDGDFDVGHVPQCNLHRLFCKWVWELMVAYDSKVGHVHLRNLHRLFCKWVWELMVAYDSKVHWCNHYRSFYNWAWDLMVASDFKVGHVHHRYLKWRSMRAPQWPPEIAAKLDRELYNTQGADKQCYQGKFAQFLHADICVNRFFEVLDGNKTVQVGGVHSWSCKPYSSAKLTSSTVTNTKVAPFPWLM